MDIVVPVFSVVEVTLPITLALLVVHIFFSLLFFIYFFLLSILVDFSRYGYHTDSGIPYHHQEQEEWLPELIDVPYIAERVQVAARFNIRRKIPSEDAE